MRKENKQIPVFDNHERFFKHIIINIKTGCWDWNSFCYDGYGRFSIKDRSGEWSSYQSHRVSYSIFNGALSKKLLLDHMCRNRRCCNPDHLREVTPRDNVLFNSDSFASHNYLKEACPSGHVYSPENTRFDKKNGRYCLMCKKLKKRVFDKKRSLCK